MVVVSQVFCCKERYLDSSSWCEDGSSRCGSALQLSCSFTTWKPAVTDVFGSGRNVIALRPGRRVCFR